MNVMRRTLLRDYGLTTGLQAALDTIFNVSGGTYRVAAARIKNQTIWEALATDIKNIESDADAVMSAHEVVRDLSQLSDSHVTDRLPSSAWLKAYSEIDPSFPGRVLSLTEIESEHRRLMQKKIIYHQFCLSIGTNICALLAIGLVTAFCWFLAYKEFATQAATVAGTVMVALAAIFIRRRSD